MWEAGPWWPMWSFWWIVPLLGMLLCFTFMVLAARFLVTGRGLLCMGGSHGAPRDADAAEMRREITALRAEVERLKTRQPGA